MYISEIITCYTIIKYNTNVKENMFLELITFTHNFSKHSKKKSYFVYGLEYWHSQRQGQNGCIWVQVCFQCSIMELCQGTSNKLYDPTSLIHADS